MQATHWASHLIKYRYIYLAITLLCTALSASQIPSLKFSADMMDLISKQDPHRLVLERINDLYIETESVVFMVQPADKDIFTPSNIRLIEEITQAAWSLPYATRVDSLTNYSQVHGKNDEFLIEPLISTPLSLGIDAVAAIELIALADQRLTGVLISEHSIFASVVVNLSVGDQAERIQEITTASNLIKQHYEALHPGLEIYIYGEVPMKGAVQTIPRADGEIIMPLVGLMIFVLLGVMLRSTVAVLVTLSLVGITMSTLSGIIASLGIELNPISMNALNILMVLTVADSVHLISQYLINLRNGQEKFQAMKDSMEKNIKAIFLTSLTTVIGFLAFNLGGSPAYQDWGNITAIGVCIAFITTFTFLPAITLALPALPGNALSLTLYLEKLSRLVVKRNNFFLYATFALVVGVSAFIPTLDINDDFSELFHEKLEIQKSIRYANQHWGAMVLFYTVDSGQPGDINDPKFLNTMDQFSNWLRKQPSVSRVSSYVDVIKDLNQAMHNDDEAWFKIPDQRTSAAQYLLLYELGLPEGHDVDNEINHQRSALRLSVFLNKTDNLRVTRLERDSKQWFIDNAPEYLAEASSVPVVMAHWGNTLIKMMLPISAIVIVLITIVMMFGLKSIKYGLISLIPNLFPALVIYGLYGILVGEVNQAAAVTFSISLGLVIDDTVHILTKYLSAKRAGQSKEDAIHYAFSTTGTALIVTTLCLSGGFLMMLFSAFVPNHTIAIMIAGILLTAIFLDFLFLPALLMRLDSDPDSDALEIDPRLTLIKEA